MKKDDPTKSKGIHDPWRLGTDAWRPPEDDIPTGAQGSEDDFDSDLKPAQWYIFKVQGAALKVVGAGDPVSAVVQILDTYKKDAEIRRVLESAGFTDKRTEDAATGFVFNAPNGLLCCPDARNADDGLQRLNKALRAAIRNDPTMKQRLNKWGIIPLVE